MNVAWSVINSRYTLTCLLIKYNDFCNTNIDTCHAALGRRGALNDRSADYWYRVVFMLSPPELMLTRIFVCRAFDAVLGNCKTATHLRNLRNSTPFSQES
jgi:hypothetical protein